MSKTTRKEVYLNDNVLGELEIAVSRGESKSVKAQMEKILTEWAFNQYAEGESKND